MRIIILNALLSLLINQSAFAHGETAVPKNFISLNNLPKGLKVFWDDILKKTMGQTNSHLWDRLIVIYGTD
jgi:hypothetical protein